MNRISFLNHGYAFKGLLAVYMGIMALTIMPSFKSMTFYFTIYGHHGFDDHAKFQEHDNLFYHIWASWL